MMANTGPGEAIRVKYVLNARKSSHGLLVWKRRRRRKRPGSGAYLPSTLYIFDSTFFFESLSTLRDTLCRHLRQHQPRSSLSLLCCCPALGRHPAPSTRRCCSAQRVRLRGPSPKPIPAGVVAFRWHLLVIMGLTIQIKITVDILTPMTMIRMTTISQSQFRTL
jgi:hypothetical protein